MSSWWRKIAEARGVTHVSTGSWKRRVALSLASSTPGMTGGSWPRILATHGATNFQTHGSWTRRLTPGNPSPSFGTGSWARNLYQGGGPA